MVIMVDLAFISIHRSQYIPSCNCEVAVMATGELPSLGRIFNNFVTCVTCTDAYSEDVHNSPSDSQPDVQSLPHEGELDFYETNCHWRGCGIEFDTQDELVRVFTIHLT